MFYTVQDRSSKLIDRRLGNNTPDQTQPEQENDHNQKTQKTDARAFLATLF